jgi:hypothetical protein
VLSSPLRMVRPSPTRHITVVLLALYSISPSLVRTSLMQFNRSVFICMTLESLTMRYIQGTLDFGLHLRRIDLSSMVAYSDADWVGCLDTRRSTSGYSVFLGDSLVSCSSKRQSTVSHSSAEAEYRLLRRPGFDSFFWSYIFLYSMQTRARAQRRLPPQRSWHRAPA